MKNLMVVSMALAVLAGCAALHPAVNTNDDVPKTTISASDSKTVTVPNWPMVSYVSESGDAFVLLGIKDPKGFPIPLELQFKSKDGKIVKSLKTKLEPAPADVKGEQPK